MKPVNFLLFLVLTFELALLSVSSSASYLSDTATSDANVFSASLDFTGGSGPTGPSGATGPSGYIVINEIFESSDNQNEWIELFNGSASEIDISGWKIADNDTGGTDLIPTTSPIPSGGYGVIVTQNTTVTVPQDTISVNLNSLAIGTGLGGSGETLFLMNKSDEKIDSMNYGDENTEFPTPPPAPSPTQSVARIPNGNDTDTAGDWVLDDSPTIGEENSL